MKIGQRIVLQQFCIEKDAEIKQEIETITGNEAQKNELDIPGFWKLLEKWMNGF